MSAGSAWHLTALLSPQYSSFRHQGTVLQEGIDWSQGAPFAQLMDDSPGMPLVDLQSDWKVSGSRASWHSVQARTRKKVLSKKIHPTWQDINNLRGSLIKPALPYLGRMMLAVYFLSPFLLSSAFPSLEGPHGKKNEVAPVMSDSLWPHGLTIALQAPLSVGFSGQEYWSGLPFPPPEDLPGPGIKPGSPASQADSSPSEPQGSPLASHQCLLGDRVPQKRTLSRNKWKPVLSSQGHTTTEMQNQMQEMLLSQKQSPCRALGRAE